MRCRVTGPTPRIASRSEVRRNTCSPVWFASATRPSRKSTIALASVGPIRGRMASSYHGAELGSTVRTTTPRAGRSDSPRAKVSSRYAMNSTTTVRIRARTAISLPSTGEVRPVAEDGGLGSSIGSGLTDRPDVHGAREGAWFAGPPAPEALALESSRFGSVPRPARRHWVDPPGCAT